MKRDDWLDWVGAALMVLAGLIIAGLWIVLNVAVWHHSDDPIAGPVVVFLDAIILGGAGFMVVNRS